MDQTPSGVLPYPGLRPFRADEADIFFGREHQTDELLTKLQTHRFIAVTGPSGCGHVGCHNIEGCAQGIAFIEAVAVLWYPVETIRAANHR
jgi:hypothetical protein